MIKEVSIAILDEYRDPAGDHFSRVVGFGYIDGDEARDIFAGTASPGWDGDIYSNIPAWECSADELAEADADELAEELGADPAVGGVIFEYRGRRYIVPGDYGRLAFEVFPRSEFGPAE